MALKFTAVFVVMMAAGTTLAIPSPLVDRIPEGDSLIQESDATDAYAKAVQMRQTKQAAGVDDTMCRNEANAVITDIIVTTNTSQTILYSLPNGDECAEKGQPEVRIARTEHSEAVTRHDQAVKSLEAANSLFVTVETYSFSFLKNASCGWERTDAAYLAAEASWTEAVEEESASSSLVNTTSSKLIYTIREAAELKKECECVVKGEHTREWTIATENAEGSKAAWDQAHNMLCVLDGSFNATHKLTTCTYDTVPQLNKPYINEDAENQECQIEEMVTGECNLDELVGQEFYVLETSQVWKGDYYCYHIKVGSIEEEGHIKQDTTDVTSNALECNSDNFSIDQVVGQTVSKISDTEQLYSKGSSQYCGGTKQRQGVLSIRQDPSAAHATAVVSEPSGCEYEITVTVPICAFTPTAIEASN